MMVCALSHFTPRLEPVCKALWQREGVYEMDNYRRFFFVLGFLTIFFGSVAAGSASAATLYVATNGSDSNSGLQSSPVATVGRAFALAAPGDTIYLRGGRYNLSRYVYLDKAGLTLSSYPGESAVVVGSNTDATNMGYVFYVGANNITIQNLEIQGGETYVLKIELNQNVVIRNCRLWNSGRDCVKTFNADNLLIEKCDIGPSGVRDASNAEGIDSIGSVGITIRDNYFHDIATNGLYLKGGARNGIVERNRLERCGHGGILLGQDTDLEYMRDGTVYECLDSVARNNVIINANGAGVGTYSGSNIRFENNTCVDVAKQFHAGFYVVTNSREVPARQISFKNNVIVVNSTRPMAFVINLSDNLTSNSNIWYRPAGGLYKFFLESPTRTFYWESFSDWQAGMNADGRSLVADPMLDSANVCQPLTNSPTIDKGETVSNPTDYSSTARPQGAAYDIGAHERGGATTPPANQPPTVSVTATPTTGTAPLNVAFVSNASDPERQALTFSWNFGDGQTANQASPSHIYQSSGTFTARLTVTDTAGATATATATITANAPTNRPPTVSVTPSTTSGPAALSVVFNTTATDPDGTIASYNWDFGDGQTANVASPTHVYQNAGTYTARITVRDNGGATAGTQVTITVTSTESQQIVVKLVTPVGGEQLTGGSTYTIVWSITGMGVWRQDVAYSLDDGLTWVDIVNGPGGYNSLEWTVPNVKCKFARIRVVVYGPRGTEQDQSPGKFTILKNKRLKQQLQ
jgi:PKD repeat protein